MTPEEKYKIEYQYPFNLSVVKSDQIRKGQYIKLRGSDWLARIEDDYTKRPIRLATVFGYEEETGSIYITDAYKVLTDKWHPIEITEKHRKTLSPAKAILDLF
jgi:hypothetical protein